MATTRRASQRIQDFGGVKSMKDVSDSDDPEEEEEAIIPKRRSADAAGSDAAKSQQARELAQQRGAGAPAMAGPSALPPRPHPPNRRPKRDDGTDLRGLTLTEVLVKHAEAVPRAARELVSDYSSDKVASMARLMTLIAHAAGYDDEVSNDDVESGEVDELVKKMAAIVVKQNQCIDLLHDKKTRSFPAAYQRFWGCFMMELNTAGLVLEEYLMERLSGLVISLSCSQVRQFRLAGTLTASHVMSGWVEVQKLLARNLSQTQFQLDAESKKKNAPKKLVDVLKHQLDSETRQSSDLETASKNIVTSVFAVRFRDVWGEVRATVIRSFAQWIDAAPGAYLADAHLKYLGWALSDKDAAVRMEAVSGLSKLYKSKDNIVGLHDFRVRFEGRMKEMINDINEDVTLCTLGLLAQLVEVGEMDQESIRNDAYELLCDSSEKRRLAAAELVSRLLLDSAAHWCKAGAAGASGNGTAGMRSRKPATQSMRGVSKSKQADIGEAQAGDAGAPELRAQLLCLLDLFDVLGRNSLTARGNAGGNRSIDVADLSRLLQVRLPVLCSWHTLSRALLDEDFLEGRGPHAPLHLATLLADSVQHAVAPDIALRAARDADDEPAVSLEMFAVLPRLLGKHQADAGVTRMLLQMLRLLRLEVLGGMQDTRQFSLLLACASSALERHGSDMSTAVAAAAALVMCAEQAPGSLQPEAALVLSKAVARSAATLVEAANAVQALPAIELQEQVIQLASGQNDGADALYHLECALVRVSALVRQGAKAMSTNAPMCAALDALLEGCVTPGRRLGSNVTMLSADIVLNALSLLHLRVCRGSADDALVSDLRDRSARFIGQLSLLHPPPAPAGSGDGGSERVNAELDDEALDLLAQDSDKLRMAAFHLLSDALVMFTGDTWQDTAAAAAFPQEAPDTAVRTLWEYASGALSALQGQIDCAEEQLASKDEDGCSSEIDDDGNPALSKQPSQGRQALLDACAHNVSVQLQVVSRLARQLAAPRALSHRHLRWLAAHLASRMVSHGQEVNTRICDVLRELRTSRRSVLAEVYMGALKLAFTEVLEPPALQASDNDENNAEALAADALQHFSDLSKRISHMYAGHNIHREELLHISRSGLKYALAEPPARFAFAAWGLGHFVGKLAQEDAAVLAAELDADMAGLPTHDGDEGTWRPLYQYLAALKDRATRAKGAARAALKGARAAAPTPAQVRPRRISFAGDVNAEGARGAGSTPGAEAPKRDDATGNCPTQRQDAEGSSAASDDADAASTSSDDEALLQARSSQRGACVARIPARAAAGEAGGAPTLHHTHSGDGSRGSPAAVPSPQPMRVQRTTRGQQKSLQAREQEAQQVPSRGGVQQGRTRSSGQRAAAQTLPEDVRADLRAESDDNSGELDGMADAVQEASQVTTGGVEPPPRPKRRRRV